MENESKQFEQEFMGQIRLRLRPNIDDYSDTSFEVSQILKELPETQRPDGFSDADLTVLVMNAAFCETFDFEHDEMTKGSLVGLLAQGAISAAAFVCEDHYQTEFQSERNDPQLPSFAYAPEFT